MNIKNAVYMNDSGTIVDVEIEHPTYGWIPYTFHSDQVDESFDAVIREYLETATISPFVSNITDMIAKKIIEIQAFRDNRNSQPVEFPEGSGVYYKVASAAVKVLTQASILGLEDSDPIPSPSNNNCWDSFDSTSSTPFTVGELKALYKTSYDIPEHNYAISKMHIDRISSFTSPEDVLSYDHTTGWK